ncbi:Stage II sporulation protein E (SpoIIE) [Musa troglodytarum]|uniref:protein-serine/threonine phosphatase n=1 Tax=Musa troglodytarum TaxID=320322 RepID=A0A9E7LAC2_9LILI|nr:Stage II sporulation protein E (SpoIIE) [Musa troglodytarum]
MLSFLLFSFAARKPAITWKELSSLVKVTYGFSVVKFIQMRGQELSLFAIFGGHLGDDVPAYLQKHLFTYILKEDKVDQLVIQLTVDHEPSTEHGSIENGGGFISSMPEHLPRVNGQLAVSRTIGDRSLKSQSRSDPDVRFEDMTADSDLLILASDCLRKVFFFFFFGAFETSNCDSPFIDIS